MRIYWSCIESRLWLMPPDRPKKKKKDGVTMLPKSIRNRAAGTGEPSSVHMSTGWLETTPLRGAEYRCGGGARRADQPHDMHAGHYTRA